MNREEIIRMAREAGFVDYELDDGTTESFDKRYERFAALVIANHPPQSFMTWQEGYEAGKQTEREAWEHRYARLQSLMDVRETQPNKPCCLAEREACAELVWPKLKVWSEEEQTAMGLAFNKAQEKHGWYETLMAVGASVLKMKAEAIRARGQA